MDLQEYREYYLNQIKVTSIEEERYPYEVFIERVADIMSTEWSLFSSIEQCFITINAGTRAFKSMHIDAGSLELSTNTLNLLVADYNEDELININNSDITYASSQMLNYFENVLRGYFKSAEQADPAVQLAIEILKNITNIYKVHLFIVSSNQLSNRVRSIELDDISIQGQNFKVELDVIDIVKIYNAQLAASEKEETIIDVNEFGVEGIPCIRADIGGRLYEAYLAVVPGEFLSNIYKKYGPRLLESNVRSFLQFRGGVNKGIRGTILNERSNFFSYNNGISTTAKSIELHEIPGKGLCITSFKDLQIINGGQTTASLASASIKDGAPLDGIYVQMKLTVITDENDDFIRKISQFANSQNKVTSADLNSNHPYYLRIEEFSRKIYAPPANGVPHQTIWFFERSRGQYEQPMMKMTKTERATYERFNPTSQRFDKTDLAKFINSDEMKPFDVAWGREVNSVRFQTLMESQWKKDSSVFNEAYYRDLIAKSIIFSSIRKTILGLDWYKENKGYLIQLVTYTFSKLIFEVHKKGKIINYRQIWDKQSLPNCLLEDLSNIAYLVRGVFFASDKPNSNIETYCKNKECWNRVSDIMCELSVGTIDFLIKKNEIKAVHSDAKKEQKFTDSLSFEIQVFQLGKEYWERLKQTGHEQGILNAVDIQILESAIRYCSGKQTLQQSTFKKILSIQDKLTEAQIPIK